MKVTFISDTHTKHKQLDLPGGDILIHAGDIMNSGYSEHDITDFCEWFDDIDNYDHKICLVILSVHLCPEYSDIQISVIINNLQ